LKAWRSRRAQPFDVWLLAERRRLAGAAEDVLREAARARLAGGDAGRAVELAGRLVAANSLDEDAQELLIRAYAGTGDRTAAERRLHRAFPPRA
jgi:DNA-binding SARP family transcriptional activator